VKRRGSAFSLRGVQRLCLVLVTVVGSRWRSATTSTGRSGSVSRASRCKSVSPTASTESSSNWSVRCPRTVLAWGESSVVSQTWLIEVPPALAPARTSYNVSVVTSTFSPRSIASSSSRLLTTKLSRCSSSISINQNDQSNTRDGDSELAQKISTGRRRFLQAAGIGATGLTGFGGLAAGQSDDNVIELEAVNVQAGGGRGRGEYVWEDGEVQGPPDNVCSYEQGNHVWVGVSRPY